MQQDRLSSWTASAPAKVILFGEHAVNRGQPALVTAVGLRTTCTVSRRADTSFVLRSGQHGTTVQQDELRALRESVARWIATSDREAIRHIVRTDFFAPTKYVLALFVQTTPLPGLTITWQAVTPMGSGLGSGAAANSALLVALCQAAGIALSPYERSKLAWQGDILAHGGIASGLDSAATTFGGLVRYSVAQGPEPLALPEQAQLRLVIGNTGQRAITAEVNGRVSAWLAAHPEGHDLFPRIGELCTQALMALTKGDVVTLGGLMSHNQEILRQLGVSCPGIERLIAAALEHGALGAKLAGSGGGGIIIALATTDTQETIAAAITAAGGQTIVTTAAVPGAHEEMSRELGIQS